MQKDHYNVQVYAVSLAEVEGRVDKLRNQIENSLLKFGKEDTNLERWNEIVINLKRHTPQHGNKSSRISLMFSFAVIPQ